MYKNILVTGGAGFIGTHLVDSLLHSNFGVIVLDSLTYAAQPQYLPKDKITFINGDITNSNLITSILENYNIDAVINTAAESHVDRSIAGPMLCIQTNIVGTANLLISCYDYWKNKKQDFIYVQVSTDEVYGSLNNNAEYFIEETPISPRSPYSASKASADHLVMAWYHTYGFPVIITRCSNNFGSRQYPEKLIPKTIKNAIHGMDIPIYGQGLNIRDWIYVKDHCHGIILALMKGKIGEVYCFGGNNELRNIDLVKTICSMLNVLLPHKAGKSYLDLITFVGDRLGHDYRYAIDFSYAQKTLGFSPQSNFEKLIGETIEWYLEQWEINK